jgi:hypothetical protein
LDLAVIKTISHSLLLGKAALYMFLDTQDDRWDGSYGAVSRDNGNSWSIGSNKVFSLSNDRVKVVGIAQFGPGYTNIPGGLDGSYFYVYLSGRTDGKEPTVKYVYLGRMKKAVVFKRSAYQYFNGLDSSGNPTWSGNWSSKEPVFHENNGMAYQVSVTYNPGIGRFIYAKGHKISHLGIFEGPKPWGPWKTVYYKQFKDNSWKFT